MAVVVSRGSQTVAWAVFEASTGKLTRYAVDAPVAALIDTAGRLVVASTDTLYRESGTTLTKLFVSSEAPLRGLSLSSGVVWLQVGDALAVLAEDGIRIAPSAMLPSDGKLIGSSTGDVWVLSRSTLRRFGEDSGGGADEETWQSTVQPVFTRLCSLCHMPGGSANLDLSTYKSWDARRMQLRLRLIEQKPSPMPPKGAGVLTQDELAAVQAWLDAKSKGGCGLGAGSTDSN